MEANPALGAAVGAVKRVQSRRFAGSYADLLAGGPYAAAARFFLLQGLGHRAGTLCARATKGQRSTKTRASTALAVKAEAPPAR